MNGYPVINLNGSTAESLGNDRLKAWHAVKDAMRAFQECSPHARDYQTAPKGQYEIALQRYQEQFASLDRLANALKDEIQYLADLQEKS